MAVHHTCDMCKNVVFSEHHLTKVSIPVSVNLLSSSRHVEYWREEYYICVDCGVELSTHIREVYEHGKSNQAKALYKALNYKEEQDETESEIDI